METKRMVEKLTESGIECGYWEKGEMKRIYINDLPKVYGLEISRYGTGNISGASLDGKKISNSSARQIVGALNFAKVWIDCETGEIHHKDLSEKAQERIIHKIQDAISEDEVEEIEAETGSTDCYAVIQIGHGICGTGESEVAALTDAKQWVDSPDTLADDIKPLHDAVSNGDLVIVPCNPVLHSYVQAYGADKVRRVSQ